MPSLEPSETDVLVEKKKDIIVSLSDCGTKSILTEHQQGVDNSNTNGSSGQLHSKGKRILLSILKELR